uniref:Intradiol ring-cleavage dioxygenases domain-containing protein n=1 Tax=Phytophthora ramorum TaxID=164328 RepID=H3H159_PHYRM
MIKTISVLLATAIAACALSNPTSAHQTDTRRALSTDQRKLFVTNAKHALGECTNTEPMRKLQERAVVRRAEAIENLRRERRQRRLDVDTVVATSHESSLTGVTADTSSSVLFGDEVACVLEPEVTYGPYYVLGEYIRSDMREDQPGVDMYIDVQVIDVSSCEPVTDMYVDFWHANATGVYSGVEADGNGDSSDTTNLDKTFLRGVTPTDDDGVAQMISIFPGHYVERATHLHFIGNYNGTVLENGTYSGGSVAHVGQFFFDQDLITSVNEQDTYVTNTQEITLNADDMWLQAAAADEYDPIMEYALLGDSVADGLFVWISLAVDMTAAQEVEEAATLTADGGVISSNSVIGGGAGGSGNFGGSMGSGNFAGSVGSPQ